MKDTLTQSPILLSSTASRCLALFIVAAGVATTGCGDDGGPSGPELAFDGCAPVSTSTDLERDTQLAGLFAGSITAGTGTVTVTVDGTPGDTGPVTLSDSMVLVAPPGGTAEGVWPPDAELVLTFSGFQGIDGSVQREDATCTFTTIDDVRPRPIAFNPPRDQRVSARIPGLEVTFSEAMNTDPTIGVIVQREPSDIGIDFFLDRSEVEWRAAPGEDPEVDGSRVLFLPRDTSRLLVYEEEYEIIFRDFVDLNGNELVEFAYRFRTGIDNEPPQVIEVTPPTVLQDDDGDGQLTDGADDVDPQATSEVCFTFDEPMRADATTGRLVIDGEGEGARVNGVFDEATRQICYSFDLGNGRTLLEPNADHRFILGVQDQRGNPLSNDPTLIDNSLDFRTGSDLNPPSVVSSTPTEGADDVEFEDLATVTLQFNEPIVQELVGTLELTVDGTETYTFENGAGYEWDDVGVTLTIDLTTAEGLVPEPTQAYSFDLSSFEDGGGNTIDTGTLGGDTSFDFRTRTPSGDTCTQVLRVEDGSPITDGVRWSFDAGQATTQDVGTVICDEDASPDLVFRYEKTSPSVAEDPVNGRYLFAQVLGDSSTDVMNIQIFADVCDPAAEGNQDIGCFFNRSRWDVVRDVPAGTYYIWVASSNDTTLDEGDLRVQELDLVRDGESCLNPLDTSSAGYTPPEGGRGAIWNIDTSVVHAADYRRTNVGTFTCGLPLDEGTNHGPDAVIAFEKTSDASFLDVSITQPGVDEDDRVGLRANLVDACDPTMGTASPFCSRDTDFSFQGGSFLPAGTYYLWIALDSNRIGGRDPRDRPFPALEVEVAETPLQVGEGCANARPITGPGSVTVARDADVIIDTPSCFDPGVAVEWWKYTAASGAVTFEPNGDSRMVLADGDDGTQFLCEPSSRNAAIGRLLEPGETICIGLPVDTPVGSFTLRDTVYNGIAGDTETDLEVTIPTDTTVTLQWFLTQDADDLFLGFFEVAGITETGPRILRFAKTGDVTATVLDDEDGIELGVMGRGGVVVGGSLFSLDDRSGATEDRLYRLFDGTTFASTQWDTGSTGPMPGDDPYPNRQVRGMASDGTDLFFVTRKESASDAASTTVFRRTAASAGPITRVGETDRLYQTTGIAVDDQFIYLAAFDTAGARSGVYRLPRGDIDAEPVALTSTVTFTSGNTPTYMALDDLTNPRFLYFTVDDPTGIHVVEEPDSANPIYLGEAVARSPNDHAFTYDRTSDVIYMFDDGRFFEVE